MLKKPLIKSRAMDRWHQEKSVFQNIHADIYIHIKNVHKSRPHIHQKVANIKDAQWLFFLFVSYYFSWACLIFLIFCLYIMVLSEVARSRPHVGPWQKDWVWTVAVGLWWGLLPAASAFEEMKLTGMEAGEEGCNSSAFISIFGHSPSFLSQDS